MAMRKGNTTFRKLPPYLRLHLHPRRPRPLPSQSSYHLVNLAQAHSPPSSGNKSYYQKQAVG